MSVVLLLVVLGSFVWLIASLVQDARSERRSVDPPGWIARSVPAPSSKPLALEVSIASLEAAVAEPIEDVIARIERELEGKPQVGQVLWRDAPPAAVEVGSWSWREPACSDCLFDVIGTLQGPVRYVLSAPCAEHGGAPSTRWNQEVI